MKKENKGIVEAIKQLNQQVSRNKGRFPLDFMFQLTSLEIERLNRSQSVTGSQRHRDPRFKPYAFTEHGVAMLSSVLRSERAVQMNVYIIRAFVKFRELLASREDLADRLELVEIKQSEQSDHLAVLSEAMKRLMDRKGSANS